MPIIVQKQIFLMIAFIFEKIFPFGRLSYIRVLLNANNRILSENRQEGEQIIFIDIRVLLNANNRTETDVSDEPLFLRKSAQLSVYCTFLFKEIGICTIWSENHKDVDPIIFMDIRVLLNANNRTETDVSTDSLYFSENLPIWPSIVYFYLRKLYLSTILSENRQEGEQIIFIDIRVLLDAKNRTETDFADEPLFWRKSAQLSV